MVPTDKLQINTHTYIDTCKFHSILLIMVFSCLAHINTHFLSKTLSIFFLGALETTTHTHTHTHIQKHTDT